MNHAPAVPATCHLKRLNADRISASRPLPTPVSSTWTSPLAPAAAAAAASRGKLAGESASCAARAPPAPCAVAALAASRLVASREKCSVSCMRQRGHKVVG